MNLEKKIMRQSVLLAILIQTATSVQAADWKPVEGKIMTRWAAQVSPQKVWPEYPRPQMVRKD